ncbi:MAG: flavodoxin [Spirochaetaceae bacterium]|nr:flavodoxin [Spirochaetaceae bacterium]
MKKCLILLTALFLSGADLQAQNQGDKILVAYFSWSGNTRAIAEQIQKETGGDIFEIKTVKTYPKEYRATTDEAKKEQNENARPALSGKVNDMDSYNVIFLGYPNWWGTIPMALFTFLESYNFEGKTIIPFCTHGGSAFGNSIRDIKKLCPKSKMLDGLAINAGSVKTSQGNVTAWLKKIGMLKQGVQK